jgi:hypothetical protein
VTAPISSNTGSLPDCKLLCFSNAAADTKASRYAASGSGTALRRIHTKDPGIHSVQLAASALQRTGGCA